LICITAHRCAGLSRPICLSFEGQMKKSAGDLRQRLGHLAPIYYLLFSLLCQVVALGADFVITEITGGSLALGWLVVIHSAVAWALAYFLKFPAVWKVFNLLFAPAMVLALSFQISSGLFTLALAVMVLVYLPTFWTRVPYYPTSTEMYETIAEELPADRPFTFIDLGCGFGSLLSYLARRFPQGNFEGVEISPLAFLLSYLRFLKRQEQVSIRLRNFWNFSFEPYDFVYAFLAPPPMEGLWDKVKEEMRPGSIFMTNSFPVPAKATRVFEVEDLRKSRLYVHKMA